MLGADRSCRRLVASVSVVVERTAAKDEDRQRAATSGRCSHSSIPALGAGAIAHGVLIATAILEPVSWLEFFATMLTAVSNRVFAVFLGLLLILVVAGIVMWAA